MKINIRHEETRDYKIVENITREAFWNLYVPGCNEHYIVNKLRSSNDFIKDISFVIEVDNEVIGSIFYSKSRIVLENKNELETVTFGPISILPKYHGMGFGRMLINYSIDIVRNMGYGAIVILGNPKYYIGYGFVSGKRYNISMSDGEFYKCLMVLVTKDGYLDGTRGYVEFSDVFNVTNNEVEKFDTQYFPYKEKLFLESHREFKELVCMKDE